MLIKLLINVLLQGRQGERGPMGFQGLQGEVVSLLCDDMKAAAFIFL